MRALVTGAAGFIGSHLVDHLLACGHTVVGVDNLTTGRLANLEAAHRVNHTRPGAFRLIICDITAGELDQLVVRARPEVVFHLAAQVDVRRSVTDPLADARINVLGTINVLQAAARAGARRVVYAASGGSLYGSAAPVPADETCPADPASPYGASKAAGELYLDAFAALSGLSTVSLALANVYGPRQDPRGEAGVVTVFGSALLSGRPTTIFGDGSSTRDYVYVGDVVEAFVRAATAPVVGRVNIGTGMQTPVAALHTLIAQAAGVADAPGYAPERAGELRASALDASRARTELGWAPAVELPEGIRRTLAWLRQTILASSTADPATSTGARQAQTA
jgi:UDP-glucose 4-epimerase